MKITEPNVYTTGKIAKLCSVSIRTVARWIESNHLKAYRLPGESTENRICEKDLLSFLRQSGLPYEHICEEEPARVLVIEDQPDMAKKILSVLKKSSFSCRVKHQSDLLSGAILTGYYQPSLLIVGIPDGVREYLHFLSIVRKEITDEEITIIAIIDDDTPAELRSDLEAVGVRIVARSSMGRDLQNEITALSSKEGT